MGSTTLTYASDTKSIIPPKPLKNGSPSATEHIEADIHTSKRQNQFPSRAIHQRRPRERPIRSQLSIHTIPHLVHARASQWRTPTRDRLPIHSFTTLWPCKLPYGILERTRYSWICHLFEFQHEQESEGYREQ